MTFFPKIGLPLERAERGSSSTSSVWHRGHEGGGHEGGGHEAGAHEAGAHEGGAREAGKHEAGMTAHAGALARPGHESLALTEPETPQAQGASPHSNDTAAAEPPRRPAAPQSFAAELAKNVAATSVPTKLAEPMTVGASERVDLGEALLAGMPQPGSSVQVAKPDASRSQSDGGANVRDGRDRKSVQPAASLAVESVSHQDTAPDEVPVADATGEVLENTPTSAADSPALTARSSIVSNGAAPANAVPAHDVGTNAAATGFEAAVPAPSQVEEHPIVGQMAVPRQLPVLNGTAEKPKSDAMPTRPSLSVVPRDPSSAGADAPVLAHPQQAPRQVAGELERAFSSTPPLSAQVEQDETAVTVSDGGPSAPFTVTDARAKDELPTPGGALTAPHGRPSPLAPAEASSPAQASKEEPTRAAFSTTALLPRAVNLVSEGHARLMSEATEPSRALFDRVEVPKGEGGPKASPSVPSARAGAIYAKVATTTSSSSQSSSKEAPRTVSPPSFGGTVSPRSERPPEISAQAKPASSRRGSSDDRAATSVVAPRSTTHEAPAPRSERHAPTVPSPSLPTLAPSADTSARTDQTAAPKAGANNVAATKPAPQRDVQPATQPATQRDVQPATQPATKHDVQPATQPATKHDARQASSLETVPALALDEKATLAGPDAAPSQTVTLNAIAERGPSTSAVVDEDPRPSTTAASAPVVPRSTRLASSPRVAETSSRRDVVQPDVAIPQAPVNPLAPPSSVTGVPFAAVVSTPATPRVAVAEATAAHPTPLVVSSPAAPPLFRLSDTRRVQAAHLDLAQQSSRSGNVATSPSQEVVGTPVPADKAKVSFSSAGVSGPALPSHARTVAREDESVGERRAVSTPSRAARPGHPVEVAQPAVAQGAPVVPLPVTNAAVGHVQSHPLVVDGRSRRAAPDSVEAASLSSRASSPADASDGARRPATTASTGEAQRTERRDVPAPEKSTAAPPVATHPPAVPASSSNGPRLDAPLPTPQAAVAAQPLYDLATADHSLQASTLGRNAHVHLDTGAAGALSLHLSVRDGVTDLEIEGPAADKLDLRPEEIRRALAGEGLSLGQFVSRVNETSEPRPQQHSTGHSGTGGDTTNNTPADAPAPTAAAPFASPAGSSSYGEGRRHWNGDGAEPADRDSLPGSRSGAGGSATPATAGDGPPGHRRGFHVTA